MDPYRFVAAVRRHAQAHYEESGWDYVVECWEDQEIMEETQHCKSEKEAIDKVRSVVKFMDDYRRDIQGTAW